MPLLVGLFDTSASRRSLDSFPLGRRNGNTVIIGEETLDLDELAAKRTAGGGMLDSIANMANSILGAGTSSLLFNVRLLADMPTIHRYYWYVPLNSIFLLVN